MTIDWENRIVYIYKSDMVQIEPAPNEGWKLDLVEFKKAITDRQDDEDGISFLDIINHYPAVELGGTVLASVVEIINGYRVEFENGIYYVLLNGANSNLMEHVILNDVSIRSNNAAGMQDLSLLRSAVFGKEVVMDSVNGRSGTLFPIGTRAYPVNNLEDAKKIADVYNLSDIYIIGNETFGDSDVIDGFRVYGTQPMNSIFYFPETVSMEGCLFYRCLYTGTLKDNAVLDQCAITDVDIESGLIYTTAFMGGTIKLTGTTGTIVFNNCFSVSSEANIPIMDIGEGQEVSINNYSGIIKFVNKTGDDVVNIYSVEGKAFVDSSCVAGTINVYGGELEDNSADTCTVNHFTLPLPSEFVSSLNELLDIEKGNWKIESDQMIFYKIDGSELMRFNLYDKDGLPTEENVYFRERL
jgi:hypothetical protein